MKSIFIMINSLGIGGAEKSLISFLNTIDLEEYRVFLQMLNQGGDFEKLIPKEVIILPEIPFITFCRKPLLEQIVSCNIPFLLSRVKTGLSLRSNKARKHLLHDTQAYWRGASGSFKRTKEKYDVAIAWGQGTPTHYVAEKVVAKKKIAWINADYKAVGHNSLFDYKTYGEYDNIVGVSDRLSKKMRTIFPDYANKISTIYDINSAKLIRSMAKEKVENTFQIGVLKLCTVGRLVKPKGYDLAIAAAEILKQKGQRFQWIIVGDGPEYSYLKGEISEKHLGDVLFLLGAKSNPYPYINDADIYVQTSRSEGFCLTLTEARILQKPCVSTCFDVVYDQLENEKNGLIVEMNGAAIAEGIQRLYEDTLLKNTIYKNLSLEQNGNEDEINKFYLLLEGV